MAGTSSSEPSLSESCVSVAPINPFVLTNINELACVGPFAVNTSFEPVVESSVLLFITGAKHVSVAASATIMSET